MSREQLPQDRELPDDVAREQSSPSETKDEAPPRWPRYAKVKALDGRTAILDLRTASRWEGRKHLNVNFEVLFQEHLFRTPSGRWVILRRHDRPRRIVDFDDLLPSDYFYEASLEEAASWFIEKWEDDGSDQLPPQIETYLAQMDLESAGPPPAGPTEPASPPNARPPDHDAPGPAPATDADQRGGPAIDADEEERSLALELRRRRMRVPAQLVDHMIGRESCPGIDIAAEVHDNPDATGKTLHANCRKVNEVAEELALRIRYNYRSEYLFKEAS